MHLPSDITRVVQAALSEDLGAGDLSAALIPDTVSAQADVVSRESAVLCGAAWFDQVFKQLDPASRITWHARDGELVTPDQVLCTLTGPARTVLSGERTALNFLQTLSATATLAWRYAQAVKGTSVKILDTRKTLPGLRSAQKYAVLCGGCYNHRHGLYDGILIKENHIIAAGSLRAAVRAAVAHAQPNRLLEVEVENMDELREALECGIQRVLLDNFTLEELQQAVQLARGQASLEASGGITLANVRAVAETGVDYISVGDLTKNIKAVDLSMRFRIGHLKG